MKIITNNQWRNFLYSYELTETEKADFDYMTEDDLASGNFFRYRNRIYSTDCFMRLETATTGESVFPDKWNGYHSDSAFSGVLIELSNCGDCYRVATYIC